MQYSLKKAEMLDAEGIQNLLYPDYFSETVFNDLTYSPENTRAMVESYLENKFVLIGVDNDTGEILGFGVLLVGKTFYEEVEADIEFFCVSKKARGTHLARDMVNALLHVATVDAQATVFYATCASGINEKNDAMWVNLWSKFGFQKLGTVMIRSAA